MTPEQQALITKARRSLNTAKTLANDGDYEAGDQVSAEIAQQQIQWAERFLELQNRLG
jgi:HEPN domain-containing protein